MGVRVCERKDKRGWWMMVNYKGKRMKKCFGRNKKLAQDCASKLSARLKWAEVNGEPVVLSQPDQTMPTVKVYLEDWMNIYVKVHCKPSTYRSYKRAVDSRLVPTFGDRPLHLLKRDDVKRLIAKLSAAGKSKGTIKNCLVPLKAAYNVAIEDGLVTLNPASRLGRLLKGQGDSRQHIKPLTRKEVITLLAKAESQHSVLHPVLLCAVRAGLRMGELIGLQWGDVDFHGGFIEVRRAVVLGQETTPKSHKIRRVDMSPQLQETLERLKEVRELESMAQGKNLELLVFLSPEGNRWDDRNLRRSWYRCLDRTGIRQVRFHDLRHTYVSLMIEQGAHPKYIQEQVGHSSIQVTMDTYGHLFPSQSRGWVAKLDDEGKEGKSAPQAHPEEVATEQPSDKPLENLVAVPRIERGTRGL